MKNQAMTWDDKLQTAAKVKKTLFRIHRDFREPRSATTAFAAHIQRSTELQQPAPSL